MDFSKNIWKKYDIEKIVEVIDILPEHHLVQGFILCVMIEDYEHADAFHSRVSDMSQWAHKVIDLDHTIQPSTKEILLRGVYPFEVKKSPEYMRLCTCETEVFEILYKVFDHPNCYHENIYEYILNAEDWINKSKVEYIAQSYEFSDAYHFNCIKYIDDVEIIQKNVMIIGKQVVYIGEVYAEKAEYNSVYYHELPDDRGYIEVRNRGGTRVDIADRINAEIARRGKKSARS
jgi:hypothetical protein